MKREKVKFISDGRACKGYILERYPERRLNLVQVTKFGKPLYRECFYDEDLEWI